MNGEEGADKIIRTSLVPYDYVQVGEKTFGELAQEQLVTYGDPVEGCQPLTDGKDTLYNPNKSKSCL